MMSRRDMLLAGVVSGGSLAMVAAAQAQAPARFAPVERKLKAYVAEGRLPFAAIQISVKGQEVFRGFYSGQGTVGSDTLYRLYSMTKPVTAAAVAALCEEGRLSLDTPVADIIPEFAHLKVVGATPGAFEPARPMTVAHLLTHSSGIGSSWSGVTSPVYYKKLGLEAGAWMYDPDIGGLDGFAARIAEAPLEFQPGDGWLYGFSHDIAGLVVQRVSGRTFGGYLKERLFTPLGMSDTGFSAPEDGAARLADLYSPVKGVMLRIEQGVHSKALKPPFAESGSAGLISSLGDYGRFAAMLANEGRSDGQTILRPQTVRLITQPYGPQDKVAAGLQKAAGIGLGGYGRGLGQGLGGIVTLDDTAGEGSRGEYAWGGAASTTFWSTPGLGLSVVVMTQLLPSGTVPMRDELRPLVYAALA